MEGSWPELPSHASHAETLQSSVRPWRAPSFRPVMGTREGQVHAASARAFALFFNAQYHDSEWINSHWIWLNQINAYLDINLEFIQLLHTIIMRFSFGFIYPEINHKVIQFWYRFYNPSLKNRNCILYFLLLFSTGLILHFYPGNWVTLTKENTNV